MRELLVLIVLLTALCHTQAADIVKNPLFLDVLPDKTPANWQFFSEGTGTGRCELVTKGSTRLVKVTRDTGGDYTGVRQRLDGYQVDPTKDYCISGAYGSQVDGLAHPCVYYLNENGQFLGAYEFTLSAARDEQGFKRRFRPHPDTRHFEIQLRAQGKQGEVRFYRCNLWEGNHSDRIMKLKDLAAKMPVSGEAARYAVLNPGTNLRVTVLGDTGAEVYADYGDLSQFLSYHPRIPVTVDGETLDPIVLVYGLPTLWKRLCETGREKHTLEVTAPSDGPSFPLLVGIRPAEGVRLKPLSVEFGGWENGNFSAKAQWIGDSEKLIAEDIDLATAEAMQSLNNHGTSPYIVESSLMKPVRGDIVRRYILGTEKPSWGINLRAAQGESEACQVVILPDANGKAEVSDVECTGLTSPAGRKISSSAVHVYRVGYVDAPWGERIPDPLFTDLKMGDPKDPVAFMVEFRVPTAVVAGDYLGTLGMTINGKSRNFLISVTVSDFELPKENHLRTCFWFFRGQIKRHYGLDHDPTWAEYAPYLDMSLRYRLTPVDCNEGNVEPLFQVYRQQDGTFSIDWTEFDRFAEYILARGANVLHLAPTQWFAYWFSDKLKGAYNTETFTDRATGKVEQFAYPYLSDEHKKMLQWYLREACDHFEKKGWLKYAYLQPFDEVGESPEVLQILRTCEDADPRVKILMDVLRPGDSKAMTDMIDIWCPLSPNLPGGGFDRVRKEGDEVWWYVCIGPKKPFANLFTNWSMVEHRQLFWQSWKYQAQGLLYWGINFWNWWGTEKPYDKETAWPAGKWSSSTTSSDTVGDGYFIYPGPDGPLPSLRLQAILDGIEDYEYLWLLDDLVKKAEAKGVSATELAEAKRLLAVPESFCKSLTEYSTNPEDLASLRERVATEIERLSRKPR